MLDKEIMQFFNIFKEHNVQQETIKDMRVSVNLSDNVDVDLEILNSCMSKLNDCWSLLSVKDSSNESISYLNDQLNKGKLKEKGIKIIRSLEFVLNKTKLNLDANECYFYSLDNLMALNYRGLPDINVVYNHDLSHENVIDFVKIDDFSNYTPEPTKENAIGHEYRNLIFKKSDCQKLNEWMYNIAIEALLRYVTNQNELEIILDGVKKVTINSNNISEHQVTEKQREAIMKINDIFNKTDVNMREKSDLLIKVMTIYLDDEADFSDVIKKSVKIQDDFDSAYKNLIKEVLGNYFDNKNKIIEEIIKTSSKINDENNKMVTQIFSVLITLLATQFFYFIRIELISEQIFSIIFVGFIVLYTIIFYFNNKSAINYYENFINNYFDVVGSVYELNNDENELKNKFMNPSLNRFKKTFRLIFSILVIIITIYVTVMFGVVGILLQVLGVIIFYELISIYKF